VDREFLHKGACSNMEETHIGALALLTITFNFVYFYQRVKEFIFDHYYMRMG